MKFQTPSTPPSLKLRRASENQRSKIELKQLVLLTLLLSIPFFLTGCSHNRNQRDSGPQQTLTIWRQPTDKKTDERAFGTIIAEFEKANPTVNVEYRAFDPDEDYETAVLNALASGSGPAIWEIRNDELPRHQDKLVGFPTAADAAPVQAEAFRKAYATTIADEMVSNGKLYGMPIAIDPLVLFLNTTHFKEADIREVPKTWTETIEAANKLTIKLNGAILRPGLALGTASNIDRSSQIIQALMLQTKTQMVDPAHRSATFHLYNQTNGQGDLSTDADFNYPGRAALQFYGSFADPSTSYYSWNQQQPYSTEAFAQGSLSMMINYLSLVPQIAKLNPRLSFTVSPVPQFEVKNIPVEDQPATISDPVYTAQYRALVVSKPSVKLTAEQQTAQSALAWQFIQFATQPEAANGYSQSLTLLPPQRIDDTSTNAGLSIAGARAINPYLATWYKGPSPRNVDQIFKTMAQAIFEQGQSLELLIAQAAQAVTQILQ